MAKLIAEKVKNKVNNFQKKISNQYQKCVKKIVSFLTERYWIIDNIPIMRGRSNEVLVVRLDMIGDFIIWLDSAKELREIYSNKKIVLCINSNLFDVASKFDYWDKIISVDVKKLRENDIYRIKFLIKIEQQGYDIAIQPTYSRELVGDMVIRASNARVRIGNYGNLSNITSENKYVSDKWYTKLIKEDDPTNLSELKANTNLIQALELRNIRYKTKLPKISVISKLSTKFQIDVPYCVIVPGASWGPRQWPVGNFVKLIEYIQQKYELKIILCGIKSEKILCNSIKNSTSNNNNANVINWAGETTLLELIEIIRGAVLLVGNESSAVHIASSVLTPSVCILGGGHFGRFLPYSDDIQDAKAKLQVVYEKMDCFGCQWKCKYANGENECVPCISNVKIENVISACEKILD